MCMGTFVGDDEEDAREDDRLIAFFRDNGMSSFPMLLLLFTLRGDNAAVMVSIGATLVGTVVDFVDTSSEENNRKSLMFKEYVMFL